MRGESYSPSLKPSQIPSPPPSALKSIAEKEKTSAPHKRGT